MNSEAGRAKHSFATRFALNHGKIKVCVCSRVFTVVAFSANTARGITLPWMDAKIK